MYLYINNWNGRLGNNILQIIRAIHYAIYNDYNLIKFNNHSQLNKTIIELDLISKDNKIVSDTFFNLKKFSLLDPEPYLMKQYFKKYIENIFFIKSNSNSVNNNDLYIHIRSGDCLTQSAHSYYIPPPFSYYTKIIASKEWNKIIVVYEDDRNPCIKLLKNKNYNNIELISSSLHNDLQLLSQCENLVIGFGTFGLLIYFLSNNIKNLYIPDYAYNEMPKGDWKINLNIIELPNYIKCGDWKLTTENLNKVIEYKNID